MGGSVTLDYRLNVIISILKTENEEEEGQVMRYETNSTHCCRLWRQQSSAGSLCGRLERQETEFPLKTPKGTQYYLYLTDFSPMTWGCKIINLYVVFSTEFVVRYEKETNI